MQEPEFAAWVAIDWAEHTHYWHMAMANTARREQGCLEHTPQAIEQWAAGLGQRFRHSPVAVCLEQSRGPLVYQLTKFAHLVLYPVHPATVSRYRAALFPFRLQG